MRISVAAARWRRADHASFTEDYQACGCGSGRNIRADAPQTPLAYPPWRTRCPGAIIYAMLGELLWQVAAGTPSLSAWQTGADRRTLVARSRHLWHAGLSDYLRRGIVGRGAGEDGINPGRELPEFIAMTVKARKELSCPLTRECTRVLTNHRKQ